MVLAVVGLLLTVGRDVDPRSAHEEPTVETMTLKKPSGLQGFKTPQNVKTEFDSEDQMKTGKDRTTVTLAEGARVMLEPHTEIGLKRDSGGIAVAIRKGGLLASITPKNNRPRFRVDTPAGQVVVTGTIFSVNVSTDAVTVSVFRGRVSVERPKHGSVAVSAGETMRIDSAQQREMTAEETEAMTRHVYLLEGNKDEPAPTGRDMKPLKENRMLSLNLAGNGAHKASAEALLKRAAKMRRMGHWPEAQAAYRQLVNEYPTRAESKLALVSLGELCLERLSDPESALHWYARYRAETPKGPLVQEAMFGEIQALEKLGRKEDEQRLLEKFLKLFPRAVQAPAVKRRLEILPQDPRQ
jgi:TolA-binding protein